jgi:microcin C transport system ATP-binding protein
MNPEALLQVQDLAVSFGDTPVVHGVSFSIERGETLALVGESGSGKTVTALSILQLLPYPNAHHPRGSIKIGGQEVLGKGEEVLRKIRGSRVGLVFQEPMTSLNPLHTIEKQISESLYVHRGLRGAAARARVVELLEQVALPRAGQRLGAYPHELSGGQRQRVMIAMALANDPDLLIADEPTTALDVTIQAQILALLRELQGRLGIALLLITHDLRTVRRLARRVCVMASGRIIEHGTTERVFSAPQDPRTRALVMADRIGPPRPVASDAPDLLAVSGLQVRYQSHGLFRRGHVMAVDGVDLRLREGETVGVVGESGSGKTSLALAVTRLIGAQGSILFGKRELGGLRSRALRPVRRELQMVFQDPYSSLSPRMPVHEIVEEGLKVHGIPRAEWRTRVERVLTEVGLPIEASQRYPHEFSGGQRQRIAIARALVLEPRLLVLDEPTSALDRSIQAQILELLRGLQERRGLSYLFISHDLSVVRALSHQIIVMRAGKVVEAGPAEQIISRPSQAYTVELMRAAFDAEAAIPQRATPAA